MKMQMEIKINELVLTPQWGIKEEDPYMELAFKDVSIKIPIRDLKAALEVIDTFFNETEGLHNG